MKNKKDLIAAIAAKTGYTKKDINVVLDAIFDTIADSIASGDGVKITGFGTFDTTIRKARTGHNPQTGEKIEIPAMTSVKFKPSACLKAKAKENDI